MRMYKEIANLQTMEELLNFVKNTESVYGDIPEGLLNLCKIALIKNYCAKIGASKISIKPITRVYLSSKEYLTKEIVDMVSVYSDNINLNLTATPVVEISGVDEKNRLDFIINCLQFITNC